MMMGELEELKKWKETGNPEKTQAHGIVHHKPAKALAGIKPTTPSARGEHSTIEPS